MLEMAFDGPVREVALFARGAIVTRRVEVPRSLPAGEDVDVVVRGVTPIAERGSARAAWADGAGGDIVLVRSRLHVPEHHAPPGDVVERVRELERARDRMALEARYLGARKTTVAAVVPAPRLDARWRRVDPAARVSDALAVNHLVGGLVADVEAELIALQERHEDNERALERAQLAARQARTGDRVGAAHPTTEIVVRIAAGDERGGTLDVSYAVPGARWWPAYSVRFHDAGARAEWALDALVAQATGEDWRGVALRLSSVELLRDARLPELTSWRWGRAQKPSRPGFRPAPQGLDDLFAGYDAAVARHGGPPPPPVSKSEGDERTMVGASGADDADEEVTSVSVPAGMAVDRLSSPALKKAKVATAARYRATSAPSAPAAPAAMPQGAMGPPPPPRRGGLLGALGGALGGGGSHDGMSLRRADEATPARANHGRYEQEAGYLGESSEPDDAEPGDEWLDFDRLALPPMSDALRGRLVPPGGSPAEFDLSRSAVARVEQVAAPTYAFDPRQLAAAGPQVCYRAETPGDVDSDGVLHRVAIASSESAAESRLVVVPRESSDVFRESHLTNPFATALLPGPVDVFIDGALLTTSRIQLVGAGGKLVLGLGVEDRVRVAKNARTEEATAGLLGGRITVDHTVTIDVTSALAYDAAVDVLERIPVTEEKEKDVEVELRQSVPKPDRYTQVDRGAPLRGGYRWRLPVTAGGKAQVEYVYRITLPTKAEIQGGNRRE